uniref:LLM class flavin-dependent oxidoreductase n=1 Tax=Sinomonas sp. TaxID=1914986 RepID=UPI002FE3BB53
MTKPLLLNAFEMLVPVHQSPGLWRHPDSQAARFAELGYWTDLARALEAGGFHGIFFADVLGQYDVYGGSADEAVRGGVQYPALDPLLIVTALAAATERLGFGVTASVTYEQPYLLARKFGTLDHLTGGRIGWNIVTSYQESAARNLGLGRQLAHDERYDRAEEFMDVVYKLWE